MPALFLLMSSAFVFGPAVAIAFGLLMTAAWWHRRARARVREQIAVLSDLEASLRTMVGELRVGAHPAAAAEAAAADAEGEISGALQAVAASTRLGGDLDTGIVTGESRTSTAEVLAQLASAWSVARCHGVPLAGVVEAVQRDVESTTRLMRQTDARMAGPRTSAGILALLPLIGIGLGEAMDAGPWEVLTTTSIGQVLLIAGALLIVAGVSWSAALTGQGHMR